MAGYYAYLIGEDGQIMQRIAITCDGDSEAKDRARQLVDGCAVELWQQARRVAVFEPDE